MDRRRKHRIELLQRIGIEFLHGIKLVDLSELYSIPYRSLKYAKAKGFYIENFNELQRYGRPNYILRESKAITIEDEAKRLQLIRSFRIITG